MNPSEYTNKLSQYKQQMKEKIMGTVAAASEKGTEGIN